MSSCLLATVLDWLSSRLPKFLFGFRFLFCRHLQFSHDGIRWDVRNWFIVQGWLQKGSNFPAAIYSQAWVTSELKYFRWRDQFGPEDTFLITYGPVLSHSMALLGLQEYLSFPSKFIIDSKPPLLACFFALGQFKTTHGLLFVLQSLCDFSMTALYPP